MELALSLGDTSKPFSFLEKSQGATASVLDRKKRLGFCMAQSENGRESHHDVVSAPPVQLDLMPLDPVHTSRPQKLNDFPFPWLTQSLIGEPSMGLFGSENSEMESLIYRNNIGGGKRDFKSENNEQLGEGTADNRGGSSSRGSDEEFDQNGNSRKKLRLTKEQSSFLEDSFKEHNTLNPKQKLALAKQLNLRPRQVEVWFQNRRARTKLKQTEVDCEYLKRCCERLTEENRRLQKELQELRALKASQPFYKQLPPTTLTMCPSCERVATTTAVAAGGSGAPVDATTGLSLAGKPAEQRLLLDS